MKNHPVFFAFYLLFSLSIWGQAKDTQHILKKSPLTETELRRWSHLDLQKDTIPGMSVDKAYAELIKKKKGKKVIVAIIDSGVDINHEDLKTVIWTNPKEIAANGIDDDKNGFIDDIHGWNFLGDIDKENLEYVRILNNKKIVEEAVYKEAQAKNDKEKEKAKEEIEQIRKTEAILNHVDATLSAFIGKKEYTIEDVKGIKTTDTDIERCQQAALYFMNFGTIAEVKEEVGTEKEKAEQLLDGKNLGTDYRKILGDNPDDIKDTKYGNANVMGPDVKKIVHGTHVAGIVAQIRNNNLGGDGIADNVSIMVIRAVPDGDEYDKDIALAIRYAVDNGAKIINASFGKPFSPHKDWVYDAIKYAAAKDVLIVHAAGNEAEDIDVAENYPNDAKKDNIEFADNLITIGAINYEYGKNILADFSNIGKKNVDVFAPGVQIYASTPENTYKFLQGTSMASPNVAGVAAMIRSYYPELSASQVKHILMDSGTSVPFDVAFKGDPSDLRNLSSLSQTGKIVNAYNALIMAKEIAKNKK